MEQMVQAQTKGQVFDMLDILTAFDDGNNDDDVHNDDDDDKNGKQAENNATIEHYLKLCDTRMTKLHDTMCSVCAEASGQQCAMQ